MISSENSFFSSIILDVARYNIITATAIYFDEFNLNEFRPLFNYRGVVASVGSAEDFSSRRIDISVREIKVLLSLPRI